MRVALAEVQDRREDVLQMAAVREALSKAEDARQAGPGPGPPPHGTELYDGWSWSSSAGRFTDTRGDRHR